MADDTNMLCLWEDRKYSDEGLLVLACRHPLGKAFCDYVEREGNEQEEYPLYRPIKESSYIEEEVRQYLEHTTEKE